MKLFVKNMVCDRCIMVVKDQLQKNNLTPVQVTLGEIELPQAPAPQQLQQLETDLKALGFEIMDDRKSRMMEKIKNIIIGLVHRSDEKPSANLSTIIAAELHYDYNYLSALFSEVEGITIEKYFIRQKIERVKELLVYDEYTLSEIAGQLGYSSVAHLSSQFKQVTGLTPSHYKSVGNNKRNPLDKV
ncbi:AraC-like DNA-binding protein [Filimonas zeae]|uniref:HTH araC/xylS-type domain-containing protein n=1 Tax=Filimonas zeae TaxID=1737353 RepID=A0A917J277_9BACT|nr:AraC family transcriptional regulator [Filimonas zeae]MDR6341615.1 AraC-like DNA-binding protein [Filimonas zeae]GGH74998.1 hypothetical protein GCM10011379_38130 [Filimonas zeae]